MVRQAEQIAWRDELLDKLAEILAASRQTVPLARRLTRYRHGARQIESEDALEPADTPEEFFKLREWTRERLHEMANPEPDSSFRAVALRWDMLTLEFAQIRALDATEGRKRRPADWRGIVAHHERLPLGDTALARQPLRQEQRDRVIAGENGRIRSPRGMALHLLHVARYPKTNVKVLRRTLERAKRDKPPAL
jgi:hypothetical protein